MERAHVGSDGMVRAEMNIRVLLTQLEHIRDVEPPMCFFALNELIDKIKHAESVVLNRASEPPSYEIGSGR